MCCHLVFSDELRVACFLVSVCFDVAHVFVAALPFYFIADLLDDTSALFALHFLPFDEHVEFVRSVYFNAEQYRRALLCLENFDFRNGNVEDCIVAGGIVHKWDVNRCWESAIDSAYFLDQL